MLTLKYTLAGKEGRREDHFTDGEKRTAVEIARLRSTDKRYGNVALIDFSLGKADVVTITPAVVAFDKNAETFSYAAPQEVARSKSDTPKCSIVNLNRLPPAPKPKATPKRTRILGVTADVFDIKTPKTPKPEKAPAVKRTTKRDRKFVPAS